MIYFMVAFLIILIIISKSPTIKGYFGELSVRGKLGKLEKDQYFIINDLTIKKSDGKTTQIDHVVVSVHGIFVIETKNYTGWIVGNEHSEYWTQVIYKRKEKLYNPLRQNYGHVQALKELLQSFGEITFVPIVTFSTRADLKLEPMKSEVIYSTQLLRTVKKYQNVELSKEKAEEIFNYLTASKLLETTTKKEHVQSIKTDMSVRSNKAANDQCPKCGGQLIQRTGKFGAFKGCGNFPKCRFVQKS